MKKPTLLVSCFSILALSLGSYSPLFAAPQKGPAYEPVAEGYCAWAGLTENNYLLGRHICSSDLRHKIAVVIFIDAAKLEDHLKETARTVQAFNPTLNLWGASQETAEMPRGTFCLVVAEGKTDQETVKKVAAKIAKDTEGGAPSWTIYANVSGSKVPAHDKLPYCCAFGPEPGDPLASGEYDAALRKKLGEIKKNKKNYLEGWKPYCGTVEEPKYMTKFAKTLASGKPLDPLAASCLKGVTAKDAEKAKECQILYDALEQTRSDRLFEVITFAHSCPHRAFYAAQTLMKQWPKTKKLLKPELDKAMAIPDMKTICNMYALLKKWGSEDFKCKNAGEAKKCEDTLKKMKVKCDELIKSSNVNVVQSAAAWIGNEAEALAPQMSSKIPVK